MINYYFLVLYCFFFFFLKALTCSKNVKHLKLFVYNWVALHMQMLVFRWRNTVNYIDKCFLSISF